MFFFIPSAIYYEKKKEGNRAEEFHVYVTYLTHSIKNRFQLNFFQYWNQIRERP